ncbi:unnamed protein product [Sphagnum troendelagicum]|uniref:Secreted protein n=1 Tax=Sphagnum troendelagicum TaxID=128251 RepID=A0ABP0TLF4_9BRYO
MILWNSVKLLLRPSSESLVFLRCLAWIVDNSFQGREEEEGRRCFPGAGFEAAAGRNRGYCKSGVPAAIYLFINEGTDSLLACLTSERNEHDNSVVASRLIGRSLSR